MQDNQSFLNPKVSDRANNPGIISTNTKEQKLIRSSQIGFMNRKSHFDSPVTFFSEITSLVDEGTACFSKGCGPTG